MVEGVPFPSPPWSMRAQTWLSLFAVRGSGRDHRPRGLYAAAFVDYGEGSTLTYHELLVALLVRDGRTPRVRITDIWVDSARSLAGGRALWAIPKEPADLPLRSSGQGITTRTTFTGVASGRPLATGTFTTLPGAALVPLPFRASITQQRLDGMEVVTPVAGSARPLPCRGRWQFDPDGPLAFLRGRRCVGSFLLRDARLTFG